MNKQILDKANEIVIGANFTKLVKARKNAALHHLIVNTQFYGLYISYTSKAVHVVDNNGNAFELK